ncbi:nucleoside hydrolase [Neorhizobium lilium]|uniref:Nucleoside hydrolase n=1 Tax=Neorhizobium lilium TaxID=2503024 RepID=A0A444LJQ1_9HYPH|nr:nucleoside hydrolase [Neorhizobium lilium]RWX79233.1 nucleoside hydrolase [Neorhizobium lilium]
MGIWIDTDMGFDDIAAIMVAAHAGLGIDGISLTFGNAPLEQVRRNAASAASAFVWPFPIYAGREAPVLGQLETATGILGAAGMPSAGLMLPQVPDELEGGAFEALCAWLEQNEGEEEPERRIMALGPLTNIAAVALARPDLGRRITELTWMGGSVTAGNHTASAEFNAFADPEALGIVLAHGIPLKMIDLDLCRQVLCAPEDVAPIRVAGGRNAELLADLLTGFIDIAIRRGRPAMSLYDAVAVVALAYPDTVTWQEARIDVELAGGLTRGRTVVETRAARGAFNAAFGAQIDAARARNIIMETLRAEATW